MKTRILSVLLVVAIIMGLFPFTPISMASATDTGLMLWYKFSETSGTTVADSSGNSNDGTLNGGATLLSGNGVELDGKNGYVQMPNGILSGMTEATVSAKVYVDSSNVNPSWIFNFGTTTDSNSDANAHYFGLLLNTSNYRVMLTKTHWSNEQNTTVSSAFSKGTWKYVTYTQAEKIGTLYVDGVQVAQNTSVAYTPKDMETTVANFIGRAPYTGDKYFKGKIADFRLYNRALSATEIEALSDNGAADIVALDKATLDLGDLANVTTNITLPAVGINGSAISWASSDENLVSSTGVVTCPQSSVGNQQATLTATITKGSESNTKIFTVTVKTLKEGQNQVIEIAKSQLIISNADDVCGNITLPTTIDIEGKIVNVVWETDKADIVNVNKIINADYDSTPAGVVTRPAVDTQVTLTANLTYGTVTDTKDIKITVKAKPATINESDYKGYLFAYFNGTSRSDAEQIYFGSSKDGLNYDELNDGNPVLTSTLGDKGVRDPFIMRSHEGDKFYLLATDLRIANGAGWSAAQTAGSKSLAVWESSDLVNWSNERLVNVSLNTAGCTWAPEAMYDEKTGEYLVYWASRVSTDNYAKQRIYVAKTRDFYTFTTPEIWIERDSDVIDATMIKYNGIYYRFSKDETNKNIVIDKSNQLLNTTFERVPSDSIESQVHVEGPTCFKINGENKWCALLDKYGEGGYYPMVSDDISSGVFSKVNSSEYKLPSGPRHGTVVQITQDEYNAVMSKWGSAVVKPVETPQTNPILEYKFDETISQGKILDTSSNNRTGALSGNATYVTDSEKKSQVLYLDGTTGTFASLPQGFFEGRDTVTISMDIKPETVTGNFFTFAIGQDSTKYMFLRTRDTEIRNAITVNSYSNEQDVKANTNSIANKWMNIKLVITPTSMAIYKDGLLLSKNSDVSISMSDLGKNLLAYLGKSFYSDPYFKGNFDNVKVYNRALTETEIAKEFGITNIDCIKNISAEGYNIITTKSDAENKKSIVYFSRNNSTEKDLTAVPLNYELTDGYTIDGTNGQTVDLSKPISVTINLPDKSQQVWTVEGVLCNNPILGGQFADPDIDVFGDKFYIYPTTDGYSGWSGTQFHVFSSSDMVDWTDEGVIIDAGRDKDVPWAVGSAWAPTIEEKNETYYFYFCAKRSDGISCIGVATSNSPTGPFKAEAKPLITPEIAKNEGVKVGQSIDPSIFTDDDGKSYMLFGNGSPTIVELNDDMVSFKSGTMKNLTGATGFREAITVTKRNGTYHFTWSCDDTGSENYSVNYGTSDNLYGPIKYQYTLLAKDASLDILGTGHHSIIKIPDKDEYYIAYHRFVTPLGQYSSGLGYHRETCIDKLEFDAVTGLMKVVTPTLDGITEPVNLTKGAADSISKVCITKNDNTVTAKLLKEDGSEFTTDEAVKYEWYRDAELVEGENSATYKLSANDKGKQISVKVAQYNLTSEGIYISDDLKDDKVPVKVEITRDDDILTGILRNEDGSEFTTDAAVKYKWYRDSQLVERENSYTYKLSDDDKNKNISVKIPQYNLTSEDVYISDDSDDDQIPEKLVLTRDDDTLTAILKNEDGSKFTTDVAVKYEWYRDNELVEDENSDTYNLFDTDNGTSIKVKVPQYGLKSESINIPDNSTDEPTPIGKGKPVEVRIEGTEIVGNTIEAELLEENGVECTTSAAATYEWYRLSSEDSEDGELVGSDKTYKLVSSDEGNYIKLVVTFEDKTFKDITSMISKKSSSSSKHHKKKSSSNSSTTSDTDDTDDTDTSENSNSSNNGPTTIIDGWKNNNDNTWIYTENGQPVSGWKQIDGTWYLMDSTGVMQTGWKQINGTWYLLKDNGAMATGWVQTNGKWYYLYSDGAMASNTIIDGYRVDQNGGWA